jgi:hypothetical protein
MERQGNELLISSPRSRVKELKDPDIMCKNEVRTYCDVRSSDPAQCGFIVQLRYTGSIGESIANKPRKMIASSYLTLAELRALLAFAEDVAAKP